jgi:hypothetical protein
MMKISGTRSYILVQFDHRTVKIEGELTTTPAFFADTNSIKNWESPHEKIPITEKEKAEIVNRLSEQLNSEFRIYLI